MTVSSGEKLMVREGSCNGCLPYGRVMETRELMHRIKRDYLYSIFFILIIICIFQYGIQKICGFTMYPDEFGYWASAAKVVGYDWTEAASLGSYYSFGYSAVLAPLLALFADGVEVYRAAVAVNMVLMCFGVLILGSIVKDLFPDMDNTLRAMAAGAAVLYPAWIFYMQMTLAEAFLTFLFVGAFKLFLVFIKKPGVGKGIALALLLVYMYCVHMRTIAIAIACFLTLALWGLSDPSVRKQMAAVLMAVAVAGLVVAVAKRNVVLSVFSVADPEKLAVNDFASQAWKIREILSLGGVWILFKEILGKIFYLGITSFGIFYWAVGWCVKEAFALSGGRDRRKGNESGGSRERKTSLPEGAGEEKTRPRKTGDREEKRRIRQWAALFLFLSVAGEVLVCSIYMHGSAQIDCLIYGRYNEFLMPVVIAVGIPAMLEGKGILKKTLILITGTGLMVPLILSVAEAEGMEGIRGYFVAGLAPLIKEENFDINVFFGSAWIYGALLMGLAAGIIVLIRKKENMAWLMGILAATEVAVGLGASTHYTYKVNQTGFENLRIAEEILEHKFEGMQVVYLDEGTPEFIDFQQMQLRDVPIRVLKGDGEAQKDQMGDFLITDSDTAQAEALEQIYNRYIRTSTFVLYFNQPAGTQDVGRGGNKGAMEDEKDTDDADNNSLYFWLN